MVDTTNSQSLKESTTVPTAGQESHITKILVAGSGAVGKSTLVRVMKDGEPLNRSREPLEYHRTPFLDFQTVGVEKIGGTGSRGIFLMVDVAGQLDLPIHALRDFSTLALGSVELVLLVFAADNLQSLLDLKDWVTIVKTQYKETPGRPLQFLLIMNKCDLERVIDHGLVTKMMESEPLISAYFELSCMSGEGLEGLQSWLVDNVSTGTTGE